MKNDASALVWSCQDPLWDWRCWQDLRSFEAFFARYLAETARTQQRIIYRHAKNCKSVCFLKGR